MIGLVTKATTLSGLIELLTASVFASQDCLPSTSTRHVHDDMNDTLYGETFETGSAMMVGHTMQLICYLCDARCAEAMAGWHAADALRNDLDTNTNVREAPQLSNPAGDYESGRLVPCKLTGLRL